MTINEMVAKRKKLLDAMDGFLETHKNANGVLSKEDDAAYAEMESSFQAMTRRNPAYAAQGRDGKGDAETCIRAPYRKAYDSRRGYQDGQGER